MNLIPEISGLDFKSKVLQSKEPVLVAFLAPWSEPCRTARLVLNEVASACAGTVKMVIVKADENPDLGVWYDIHSVPTLLYFVGGSLQAKVIGTASKEAILAKLQPVAHSSGAAPPPGEKEGNEPHKR